MKLPLIFSVVALYAVFINQASAQLSSDVVIDKKGSTVIISGTVPSDLSSVEIRIQSSRNDHISKISDVSPLKPASFVSTPSVRNKEIYYPIVDVKLQPGMSGNLVLSGVPTTTYVNQHINKSEIKLSSVVNIASEQLSFWENAVCLVPVSIVPKQFYLSFNMPVVHGNIRRQFDLLSNQWSGTIEVYDNNKLLASHSIGQETSLSTEFNQQGDLLSPDNLLNSIHESLAYTLRSQEKNPSSPFFGGLNLFYDYDAATYRSNYWIWGWGPSVSLLLEANKRVEISKRFPAGKLKLTADQIGKASLSFIVKDKSHPSFDVPVSRWNRNLSFNTGFEERISVADAQFLSGWAWIPLYKEFGDTNYLKAAKDLTLATARLSKEYGVIPQDYYQELNKWSEHILDESGFGMEGLAELYSVTKDVKDLEIGRTYFEAIRNKLQRPDGLWERGWNRTTGVMPAIYVTRGMGWAMEGLIAADRAMPDTGYLDKANTMAEFLMKWQHSDGSFSFNADKPVSEVGIGDKATALWSLLFYRLYNRTHNPRHLLAARKALNWCVKNQYYGSDIQGRGAIVCVSPASAVGYREWFRVSCTYTSAFFGLAALEELKLQNLSK